MLSAKSKIISVDRWCSISCAQEHYERIIDKNKKQWGKRAALLHTAQNRDTGTSQVRLCKNFPQRIANKHFEPKRSMYVI